MQEKIQRPEVWQLEPVDVAMADAFEMFFDARGRNLARDYWIELRLQSDQTNIRCVALIARPGVSKSYELYLHKLGINDFHACCDFVLWNQCRPIRDNFLDLRPAPGKTGYAGWPR